MKEQRSGAAPPEERGRRKTGHLQSHAPARPEIKRFKIAVSVAARVHRCRRRGERAQRDDVLERHRTRATQKPQIATTAPRGRARDDRRGSIAGGIHESRLVGGPPTPTVIHALSDGGLRGVRSAKLDERESEEKRDERRQKRPLLWRARSASHAPRSWRHVRNGSAASTPGGCWSPSPSSAVRGLCAQSSNAVSEPPPNSGPSGARVPRAALAGERPGRAGVGARSRRRGAGADGGAETLADRLVQQLDASRRANAS